MSVCSLWTLKRLNRLGSKFLCLFKGFQGVSSKEKISRISYPSYIHTYAPKKSNYCGLNPAHEPMNHIDHLMGWNMGSIDLWAQRQLSADGWALTLSYIGLGSEPNWMLTGCPNPLGGTRFAFRLPWSLNDGAHICHRAKKLCHGNIDCSSPGR